MVVGRLDGGQASAVVEKMPTGIQGLDDLTGGGLPRGRATLIVGEAGTGKTVLALQALVNGARLDGEPAVFVAFEESSDRIRANARSFGWRLDELERDHLFFLDAQVSPETVYSGEFDLEGLLSTLDARVTRMGARRIAFDGIDVLLSLLDNPAAERRELHRLHEWVRGRGLSAIVTVKAEPDAPARYRYLPFLVDCVVELTHHVQDRVSSRVLRVVKYRGSGFAANQFAMMIGPSGVQVAGPGVEDLDEVVSMERMSSGIERLDAMLGGGYYRSSSVLLTGSPGTAKSTLAAAFVDAACRRGERAMYVSFDEAAAEIVRNMVSVGMGLREHVRSGLLTLVSARSDSRSAEEHALLIHQCLVETGCRCLVIDPVSALLRAGGLLMASTVVRRLLGEAKSRGVTVVCTSLLEAPYGVAESSPLQVSTVADTWLHLTYESRGGERNRGLSIIKMRGTRHSNQVRELLLSDHGLDLRDVFTAGGEVLMGTARYEKEEVERRKARELRADIERRRHRLVQAEAELAARIAALQAALQTQRDELARLQDEQDLGAREERDRLLQVRQLRSADEEVPRE